METQETVGQPTRVERLGWQRRESNGVHVVDLMLSRTVSDLIAALAENLAANRDR
ncbi:hypothetical protein SAMN05216553_117143 [Lentzea fradiae]|uniref:Uncharacterized protein n=1 Tax=Lentzea fradiae TaxID=200378 RepID=A0A1G8AEG9_9PSEU|nr:hypothetical protein [Lentzea fradiae]SDH19291.1 hypothetical protein SAMN05216553_117143 [Lentzea fradiae]